mmetsp:Transcript_8829/g.25682  ORF Transcript_8829/g.25682 Transcript_8829/m.25682 type:complete len:291 (-) Transcript_8829:278-1150(-)
MASAASTLTWPSPTSRRKWRTSTLRLLLMTHSCQSLMHACSQKSTKRPSTLQPPTALTACAASMTEVLRASVAVTRRCVSSTSAVRASSTGAPATTPPPSAFAAPLMFVAASRAKLKSREALPSETVSQPKHTIGWGWDRRSGRVVKSLRQSRPVPRAPSRRVTQRLMPSMSSWSCGARSACNRPIALCTARSSALGSRPVYASAAAASVSVPGAPAVCTPLERAPVPTKFPTARGVPSGSAFAGEQMAPTEQCSAPRSWSCVCSGSPPASTMLSVCFTWRAASRSPIAW